jgi:3-oxoacyl-[acyl-carrier protein] reductase
MDAGVMLGLRGKRALVSGGSRGVGRAAALMLARAGADVGIGYLSREDEAQAVVAELRALGVRAFAQAGNLATPWGAELLFERGLVEFGGVDVFIGNAGIWTAEDVRVAVMTDAQWARTLEVNLTSIFNTVRLAARFVSDGRGASCWCPPPRASAARPSTPTTRPARARSSPSPRASRVELAPRGITVNCVAPGWIDTEMVERPMADRRAEIERAIPLGRIASADDVAGPIVMLCSALARHVTARS